MDILQIYLHYGIKREILKIYLKKALETRAAKSSLEGMQSF